MSGARILFVDDDEILSALLAMTLELEGYRVDTAANGEQGLKLFAKDRYDLILLDLVMPRIDGIRFLRLIGESGREVPPVLVFSSAANTDLERLSGELGVVGFARKPIEPARLLAMIAAALAGVPGA